MNNEDDDPTEQDVVPNSINVDCPMEIQVSESLNAQADDFSSNGGGLKGHHINDEINHDSRTTTMPEYQYTQTDNFTSELFKLSVSNLPKYLGVTQFRKRLSNQLNVHPVKFKTPGKGIAYVTFKSEEEREEAMKVMEGHTWKGLTWSVKVAMPIMDPLQKKRKEKNDSDTVSDEVDERSDSDKINDAVTPSWRLTYEKQLERKQDQLSQFISKLTSKLTFIESENWLTESKKNNGGKCCSIEQIIPSPELNGYRNKCEFTIGRGITGVDNLVGFRLGAYKLGNVCVVEPDNCLHVHESMIKVVKHVQNFLQTKSNLSSFDSVTRCGFWRTLAVRTTKSMEVMCILQCNFSDEKDLSLIGNEKQALVEMLTNDSVNCIGITSFYFEYLPERNNCLGYKSSRELLFGKKYIYETLSSYTFQISPDAFFQVNTAAAELLFQTIKDWCEAKSDNVLFDICCGTGTIGTVLSNCVNHVVGVDIVESAVNDAITNSALNNVTNCEWVCGPAETVLPDICAKYHNHEIVAVADPPRGGLHKKVVKAIRLCEAIQTLVIVSCNPPGILDNLLNLVSPTSKRTLGTPFKILKCAPFDLFPHTNHYELVLLLKRC